MATGFATSCHLHFFYHAAFFHTAFTWQVEPTQHGNCSCCDMVPTVQLGGNYSATTWQLYLLCHSDCSWTTHGNCPTFSTYISHHGPLPPHNPSVFGFYMYPNPLFFIFIAATPEEISPSLDEVYRMIEETALQRSSSRGQGQSSSNVPADTVSEDTIRSATPGSVRQQRVVHPPPAEDYEPEFRATKEQTQLYDIVKRFGNARSNSKHMKELKA